MIMKWNSSGVFWMVEVACSMCR